ncbi:MAG: glycosyltransferase involved in cell wall biosynthesis [Ulvibacter sp.]|jgi:glycosyltransferase involved in cell wall biosynthesis
MKLSIIVPCYKTAPFLRELVERMKNSLSHKFEIISINDNSPLNDWEVNILKRN